MSIFKSLAMFLAVGAAMPSFASDDELIYEGDFLDARIKDVNGEIKQLSKIVKANKLVLVDFWASWCGPCRKEFPALKKVYAKYKGKGFEIVTISIDQNQDDWRSASEDERIGWVDTWDIGFNDTTAKEIYSIYTIPSNFLYAADLKLIGSQMHGEELDKILSESLGR